VVRLDDPRCTWTVPDAKGRIVLVGDSHADMWSEAVVAAGNSLGYDVTIDVRSGCPMVSGTLRSSEGVVDHACARYVDRTLDELRALRPALVMFGAGSTGVLADGGDLWKAPDGSWVSDVANKAAIWQRGLTASVTALADAGLRSVIIHDIPYHPPTNVTCGRLKYLISPSSCASETSLQEVRSAARASVRVENAVRAGDTAVTTMNPIPWLCHHGSCSAYQDGTWSYRDGDHLSVAGTTALAPRVRSFLAAQGF
jgi:hypothetical protein